ncbi:MAG TPA: GNAT family N-acetyltransferase [Candidatus Saccharimonadales bacterium]|nr:GNAT family N-acetyltransferase [Candidatus Saccharimonadales bacterium]
MGEIIHTVAPSPNSPHDVPPVQRLALAPDNPHMVQAAILLDREIQHSVVFDTANAARIIRKYINLRAQAYGIIEPENGAIASVGMLLPNYNGGHVVSALATTPEYRGRGYATAILDKLGAVATELGSEYLFLSAQPNTKAFYEERGFESAHRHNALNYLMRKNLFAEQTAE